MRTMIGTEEAGAIIAAHVQPLEAVVLPLADAARLVLAEDVMAPLRIPAFPQSSMDGYAFSFAGWQAHNTLHIDGVVPAGSNEQIQLQPQTATRIFTGAPVPHGADTVVMQEKVHVEGSMLHILDAQLQLGANVRPAGSEMEAGELALPKGSPLSAAAVGFLAGLGITQVPVVPNPTITIIVTGNELQQPGRPLAYGQVYESNSFALTTALSSVHITNVAGRQVHDDPAALANVLGAALNESDVVLLTGGVSVGDYDFVIGAATQNGVTPLFHKIKQRPGKPLFMGMQGKKLVFGLPGNPSSVLTCFYLYVLPALSRLTGRGLTLKKLQVPLRKPYKKAAGITHFLKGAWDGQTAIPLNAQESYKMRSFAQANCLIQVDENIETCVEDDLVTIHLLPV
ncbi:molybdopterin molybdotransferase MoeA [Pseudocnuella soli]|uniref:molybdopterin molybdotransferase MoeA n=1 Tax=Pseudocnuella soli TaxID=2502779 RepID=UPI001F0284C8|nr:gephyrin-like molybdotransferase Glp [Pseudocnuella soli]